MDFKSFADGKKESEKKQNLNSEPKAEKQSRGPNVSQSRAENVWQFGSVGAGNGQQFFDAEGGQKFGAGDAKKQQFGANEDQLKQKIKQYEGMSEDELLHELLSQAAAQKEAGNLSAGDLDGFRENLMPFLSPEQQKRLNNIIKMLK